MPAQRSAAAAVRILLALSGVLAADLAWSASAPDRVGAAVVGARLADRIVGTWELVSYKVEDKETGTLVDAMGGTPRGRVIFTKDGWVAFNL